MKKSGVVPDMPPNMMPHIVDRLTEIGLVSSNGMSTTPLGWGDIADWQRGTGIQIGTWECRLLRSLSVAYVAESHVAEDENCPPPWRGEVTEAAMAAEIAILDAVLD